VLGDCVHSLTVDEPVWDSEESEWVTWRRCISCDVSYNRQAFLSRLERAIRDRWHPGLSPWTAEELGGSSSGSGGRALPY
jgi:hypothetical protein